MATNTKIKEKILIANVNKNKNEFLDFIRDYNVLQLAIGVVVGNSVKDLVNSIASNLIMPIIGALTPSGAWQKITLHVFSINLNIGLFLSSLLDFLIVAGIVFIVVKKVLRIDISSKSVK